MELPKLLPKRGERLVKPFRSGRVHVAVFTPDFDLKTLCGFLLPGEHPVVAQWALDNACRSCLRFLRGRRSDNWRERVRRIIRGESNV